MKICIATRTFSKQKDGAPKLLTILRGLYEAISTLSGGFKEAPSSSGSGLVEFDHVQIIVPTNPIFVDCDYGGTANMLRMEGLSRPRVSIVETRHDLFCGALNEASVRAVATGCDHLMVVSPEVASYLTAENIMPMVKAMKMGAKVSGLAINELSESVMEGRVANTLALWNIEALLSVGGFDMRASNARVDNRLQQFVRGQATDGKELFYPLAGVEEIIPSVRLIDAYGKCIAPVRPISRGVWQEPTEPEARARHHKKMASKWARQALMAGLVGVDLDFLKTGLV